MPFHYASDEMKKWDQQQKKKEIEQRKVAEAAYAWERATGLHCERTDLTPKQCRDFIHHLWSLYSVMLCPQIKFSYYPGAVAKGGKDRVLLPIWGRNKLTICHEVAHALTAPVTTHGANWKRNYITLLSDTKLKGKRELLQSLKVAKLEVAPASQGVKRLGRRMGG